MTDFSVSPGNDKGKFQQRSISTGLKYSSQHFVASGLGVLLISEPLSQLQLGVWMGRPSHLLT